MWVKKCALSAASQQVYSFDLVPFLYYFLLCVVLYVVFSFSFNSNAYFYIVGLYVSHSQTTVDVSLNYMKISDSTFFSKNFISNLEVLNSLFLFCFFSFYPYFA
jgi:hypothetical protein